MTESPGQIDMHTATGNGPCVLAGRIAYSSDATGPR